MNCKPFTYDAVTLKNIVEIVENIDITELAVKSLSKKKKKKKRKKKTRIYWKSTLISLGLWLSVQQTLNFFTAMKKSSRKESGIRIKSKCECYEKREKSFFNFLNHEQSRAKDNPF